MKKIGKKLLKSTILCGLLSSSLFGENIENIVNNLVLENPKNFLLENNLPLIENKIIVGNFKGNCLNLQKSLDNIGNTIVSSSSSKGLEISKMTLKDNSNYINNLLNNNLNKRVVIKHLSNADVKVEGTIINNDPLIVRGELQDILKNGDLFFFFDERINFDKNNFFTKLCKNKEYNDKEKHSLDLKSINKNLTFKYLKNTNTLPFDFSITNNTKKDFYFNKIIYKDKILMENIILHKNQKILLKVN